MKSHTRKPAGSARPTPAQLAWQDMEIGMFIHYGMFTYKESLCGWGAAPDLFNPKKLDTDQWMRAARSMGAKYAVLTAKHQDNFCLWPTEAYDYSVKLSKWRRGKGDVVADFVASCRKYGIKPGLYCCLPPKHQFRIDGGKTCVMPGDPRWKVIAEKLLTELWGNYGDLAEVWFDSSVLKPEHGGPHLAALLKRLQPNAMVFLSPWATIRWVGNENGYAPYPCWSTVKELGEPSAGAGDPDGRYWCPAECDTTVRHLEWSWLPGHDHLVRSLPELMDVYCKSVGRNCNLLLNANPGSDGLIPAADVKRYAELGQEIRRCFGKSLAETSGIGKVVTLKLPRPALVDHVILMEDLRYGERVRWYNIEGLVDGKWIGIWGDSAIGHKRINPIPQQKCAAMRLRCDKFTGTPHIRRFAAYNLFRPK